MRERLSVAVRGAVQGVGYRPFVYRLATDATLDGWVLNSPQGLFLEVEGAHDQLAAFLNRLASEHPPHAVIQSLESRWLDPVPYRGFEIRQSADRGSTSTLVLPDIAVCQECRRELFDPGDRRHRYPFINCTNCGPRFSIIDALPYDRARTSMRGFTMCFDCRREYGDPCDRRFHAQPNACPVCGPRLALWNGHGGEIATGEDALRESVAALAAGFIIAVKGIGGFHLMADARRPGVVQRLRVRKRRSDKPFALMFPSIASVAAECVVSAAEARLLTSAEAPIVLLQKRTRHRSALAASVAPGNPSLGVMLPSTPLHHLLLADFGAPLIATSGNLSDEPICTDEYDALARLSGIADLFLVHDRPIVRHVDDSIVRVMMGRELVIRRARGYAPLPVPAGMDLPPVVAVGAHLKNTVAVSTGSNVVVSQHIGDLESVESMTAFRRALTSLQTLFRVAPETVVADLHPDYGSTQHASRMGLPVAQVQHHLAHVLACMAENELTGPVLGVAWDGTGYGTDGTVWGGEFLSVDDGTWTRFASLRPFRLPGGERAVQEPRRSALGVLHALMGRAVTGLDVPAMRAFDAIERRLLLRALESGFNAPITTSAGRLFDAIASLLGVIQKSTFEGQAAMALEAIADDDAAPYDVAIDERVRPFEGARWDAPACVVDWQPMIEMLLAGARKGQPAAVLAGHAHATMAAMIVAVARRSGVRRVVLTGGCFQNRLLTELTITQLRAAGFAPYWHQRVPPNDGGIALGQIAAYARGFVRAATSDRAAHVPSHDAATLVSAEH